MGNWCSLREFMGWDTQMCMPLHGYIYKGTLGTDTGAYRYISRLNSEHRAGPNTFTVYSWRLSIWGTGKVAYTYRISNGDHVTFIHTSETIPNNAGPLGWFEPVSTVASTTTTPTFNADFTRIGGSAPALPARIPFPAGTRGGIMDAAARQQQLSLDRQMTLLKGGGGGADNKLVVPPPPPTGMANAAQTTEMAKNLAALTARTEANSVYDAHAHKGGRPRRPKRGRRSPRRKSQRRPSQKRRW